MNKNCIVVTATVEKPKKFDMCSANSPPRIPPDRTNADADCSAFSVEFLRNFTTQNSPAMNGLLIKTINASNPMLPVVAR